MTYLTNPFFTEDLQVRLPLKLIFKPDQDFKTMDDILNYDYEVMCDKCGSPFRVKEGIITEPKPKKKQKIELLIEIRDGVLEDVNFLHPEDCDKYKLAYKLVDHDVNP